MPKPRISLRMIKDVIRLKWQADLSHEQIASTLNISKGAVTKYVGLSHAAGFLRRELGRRLRIHHIPELHFTYDASVEHGTRLSRLIDEVEALGGMTRAVEKFAQRRCMLVGNRRVLFPRQRDHGRGDGHVLGVAGHRRDEGAIDFQTR